MAAAVRVALVGTGRMGAAMAGRVADAGFDLSLFNRTESRARAVAKDIGGTAMGSAHEAVAEADIVVVSLADDAAVEATYRGEEGLASGLRPGAVVCDTSTVDPQTIRRLAPLVADRGATLLDCPVSGSVSVVEAGALAVMVGGDESALERARPVLEAFASQIFPMGPLGAGAAMKLVVNSLVHSLNVALSEALVLGERAGLDRAAVYDVFEAGAAGAPFVKYKREAFVHPEDAAVAFTLGLVAKDQKLIHALAQHVGARMDQADTSRRLVAEAVLDGLGERDLSAVAEFLRT
jgi:3-hydroxyisobutyrate dehydrogenase-like beta-hydroxyacid dehydrogenase